jgi:transposase
MNETPAFSADIVKKRDRAAGIDIGASEHWVCVDPELTTSPIRRFEAFTVNLIELVSWLVALGITSVAMEATGVYWRELYTRLVEAGIETLLVDPRRTKNPRGRKTDMQDCRWIWQLHACGLLDGAYVPAPEVQELRTIMRLRSAHVERCGIALKELQRALSLMNLKLQHVLSDLGGSTGQRIIIDILKGQRDPQALAKHRDYRCKHDEATLAKAMTGTWRKEHLFLLKQAQADYQHHTHVIAECDQEIKAMLDRLPQRSEDDGDDLVHKRPTGKHDFSFNAQQAAYRVTGIDLAGIDGIGPNTALSFIGEIGFSLDAWPTAKAFCSWLGLCPNPKRSGGKHLGAMPTSSNRASQILKNAAMGLKGAKNNPLSKYYARMALRHDHASAIKAVAHKMARIIYALFKNRTAYDRTKLDQPKSGKAIVRLTLRLAKEAQKLGYVLVQAQHASACTTPC